MRDQPEAATIVAEGPSRQGNLLSRCSVAPTVFTKQREQGEQTHLPNELGVIPCRSLNKRKEFSEQMRACPRQSALARNVSRLAEKTNVAGTNVGNDRYCWTGNRGRGTVSRRRDSCPAQAQAPRYLLE